ncbi:hypothetical protein [Alienimonas californiensis]|uniref:Uncharacterized protein n=1 Tax=Alienimonas californiensis TaxID=2527989 RepID=A0A517P8T1_9PLAN|nr:hypothetical protein [Alienimonas californiensis]QDT15784.1 hypothetical protein CA12_18780 [Alienimonas californiensis]
MTIGPDGRLWRELIQVAEACGIAALFLVVVCGGYASVIAGREARRDGREIAARRFALLAILHGTLWQFAPLWWTWPALITGSLTAVILHVLALCFLPPALLGGRLLYQLIQGPGGHSLGGEILEPSGERPPDDPPI